MLILKKIKSHRYLLYLFAFSLPISQKVSTISIGFILLVLLFNIRKEKLKFKKRLIFPAILYVLYCVSLLYSSEVQLNVIEQKASLLIFPIIFILIKCTEVDFKLVLKYFVIGCVVALIICEFHAFYSSLDFSNFIFNSKINRRVSFYRSLVEDKNYFFSYNFSFLHQTVYFAMYLSFAIAILLHNKLFKNKYMQGLIVLFMFFGLFQVLNKASFIVVFVILIKKIYLLIKNKKIAVISSMLLFIIAVSVFVLNPRFKSFNKAMFIIDESEVIEKDFRKINNTNPNNYNFRVMLWSSALDLIKQNPLIGIGAGGTENRLYEVFAVKRQWYDKSEKYHAHNQYLQILLDVGAVGFFFFILIFVFFFKSVQRLNHNKLKTIAIDFILIILMNFLFESMLERYSGVSFFSFFVCGFISSYYSGRKNGEKNFTNTKPF
ncbi:MAG: O-antigen ligase family protein [Flavobacteriaceae bacterium]|nr:O-antigen ligase family protein [Flavobacteriaceae bacterium]